MNYLVVENEIIINIIVANELIAEAIGAMPSYDGAAIGEAYVPPHELEIVFDPMTDLELMTVDHEFRLTLLEFGL